MPQSRPVITLLTDFGEADAFVGIMKGVMLGITPHAQLVDLSHQVPPQDIRQAAFLLMTAVPFFSDGTVHLVVVDPGVGSARRPIAVETPRAHFVAPDNGVLSYALLQADRYTAVELTNPAYRLPAVSSTFHGRDIFSPAAAHLAAGVPLSELGPVVEKPMLLDPPHLSVGEGRVEGEVLSVDHFGNVRTSIHTLTWLDANTLNLRPLFAVSPGSLPEIHFAAAEARVSLGALAIEGISSTFSEVELGRPLAYVGSEGGLEIAVNRGNAARQFGIKPGDRVALLLPS